MTTRAYLSVSFTIPIFYLRTKNDIAPYCHTMIHCTKRRGLEAE
jgi:hypothetical protein